MADPLSHPSPQPPAGQSTRQLLDELDALMQRMLALPVQAAEDEPPDPEPPAPSPPPRRTPSPVEAWKVEPPASAAAQEIIVNGRDAAPPAKEEPQPPAPAPAAVVPPRVRAPELVPPPRDSVPVLPLAAPTYLPLGAEPLLPLILQRPGAKPARPAEPPPSGAPVPPPPPKPQWLKPAAPGRPAAPPVVAVAPSGGLLVGINRHFDRATAWLGGAGRWLRGEQGRNLLGWTGVAMLGAALVWAALRFLV
jgi:hypothetical protein